MKDTRKMLADKLYSSGWECDCCGKPANHNIQRSFVTYEFNVKTGKCDVVNIDFDDLGEVNEFACDDCAFLNGEVGKCSNCAEDE